MASCWRMDSRSELSQFLASTSMKEFSGSPISLPTTPQQAEPVPTPLILAGYWADSVQKQCPTRGCVGCF